MEREWWSLDIWGPSGIEEIVQSIVWSFHCLGVKEEIADESFHYVVYFQSKTDLSHCQQELDAFCAQSSVYLKISESCVKDGKWETSWHQYFKPLNAGNNFIIYPPWDVPENTGRQGIIVEPGQAFGSGQHETTQLMIELIEKCELPKNRWLDLGCGSGVLGICARYLGAPHVTSVDIDFIAVAEARRNFSVNAIQGGFFITGTAECLKKTIFDAVMANLNERILLRYSDLISALVAPDGYLFLSGFLTRDAALIIDEYFKNGLVLKRHIEIREWSAAWFAMP